MPNHLHILLTPGESTTLEKAMQLIKGGSSYEIHKRREHRMEIWQAGFFESTIRDAADFRSKADYIRQNPVEATLVGTQEEWPYGSARSDFAMDEWPSGFASGAKAPEERSPIMSELKLRPPKADSTSETDRTSETGSGSRTDLASGVESASKAGTAGEARSAGKVDSTGNAEPTSNRATASKAKAAGQ